MRFLKMDLKVPRKQLLAVTLLTSGAIAWFLFINSNIADVFATITRNDSFWIYYNIGPTLFYASAIFGVGIGILARKFNRKKLLSLWILLGVLSSIFITLFEGAIFATVSSLFLGISFGFGLPTCLALIAECTAVEERARVSGIIILSSFIIVFAGTIIGQVLGLGVLGIFLLFAALRAISFSGLIVGKCETYKEEPQKSHLSDIAYREFAFFLIPWAMFQFAASFAFNLIPGTPSYQAALATGSIIRYVFIALFALISGVAADRIGRKIPIIIGLVMLGISFVLLAFAKSPTSVLIYLPVSGIAWGTFFSIYLAIPGDISVSGYREKFYGLEYGLLLGVILFWIAIPGNRIFANFPANSFALILSAILFVSVVPVLLANETLSGKKITERKMKRHLDKIEDLIRESEKD